MTHENLETCSLNFGKFSIELTIDFSRSSAATQSFGGSELANWAFAVGEVWLRIDNVRHQIIDEFNAGNLVEMANRLLHRLDRLPISSVTAMPIPVGGWCEWMTTYWKKIDEEIVTPEDEATYDLLDTLAFAEGLEGRIAIYQNNGRGILEVGASSQATSCTPPMSVWCEFDVDDIRQKVESLRLRLIASVSAKSQGPLS